MLPSMHFYVCCWVDSTHTIMGMEEEENVHPLLTPVIMNSDNESFDEGEERISFFSYGSYILLSTLLAEKLRSQISLVIRSDGKEHEQFNKAMIHHQTRV